MPVALRQGGLRYYFFSNEGQPPELPHIHVKGGGRDAKIWLEPGISIVDSYGFNPRETFEYPARRGRQPRASLGMTISATSVRFDEHSMWVELSDGRTLGIPLAWFPRLLHATPDERNQVELSRVGCTGTRLTKISPLPAFSWDAAM
jgi:hypothetical protein